MSITTVDYGDAPVFMAVTPFATMRACPICECTEHTIIQTLRDFQFFTDAVAPARPKRMTLHDVQCTNCGTLYKNPTYTDEGYRYLFSETAGPTTTGRSRRRRSSGCAIAASSPAGSPCSMSAAARAGSSR